jgi:hypothetical protein
MNSQEKKDLFLELRIKGETFQSIAENLNVSKQTLINWSKEKDISETIKMANVIKYQSLVKQYRQSKEEQIKYYLELTLKIKDEILNRELSSVTTENLIKIIFSMDNKISELLPSNTFGGENILQWETSQPAFIFDPKE